MSKSQTDSSGVITKIQVVLKESLNKNIFELWIKPLVWSLQENTLTLTAPDRFFKAHFERNFLEQVASIIQEVSSNITIVLAEQKPTVPATSASKSTPVPIRLPGMKPKHKAQFFLPNWTFENFVTGECNTATYSACRIMAEKSSSEPMLFIDSNTGLGKSHLTSALGAIAQKIHGQNVRYITSNRFCREMVAAIQAKTMNHFQEYYNTLDILILENITALKTKPKTIEEFSEIVDCLIKRGKKLIITSLMPLKELEQQNIFDSQLLSKLGGGYVTSIRCPTQPTKVGIIKQLSTMKHMQIPQELIALIANQRFDDIRKLERVVTASCHQAKNYGLTSVSEEIVLKELQNVTSIIEQRLSTKAIKDLVSKEFNVSEADLISRSRKKVIAFPRQMAMYLAKKHTAESLYDIGSCFNRNHATVIHSIKVISDSLINNTSIQGQLEMLEKKLQTGGFIN